MQAPALRRYADPHLVELWLRARSISRGLPQPVADQGGLRVETGMALERRRYVFAQPCEGLRHLAETLFDPLTPLKLCGPAADLLAHLAPHWVVQPTNHMMICEGAMGGGPWALPDGYALRLSPDGATLTASISTDAGELAASGRAVGYGKVFIYDQIVTQVGHRRRGLGCVLMTALQTARSAAQVQVLVATTDGRRLYERLGWASHADYTTAIVPSAEQGAVQ